MVGDEGQLYTIEGVAAAILMVVTAFLILNSAYILTPGDTHISDMQLEQLGNDVLRMMDTSTSFNASASTMYDQKQSELEKWLSSTDPETTFSDDFIDRFQDYTDDERLQMNATVYYWDDATETLNTFPFAPTSSGGREHYVTVTRWVYLDNPAWDPFSDSQTVLLEVQLWRD